MIACFLLQETYKRKKKAMYEGRREVEMCGVYFWIVVMAVWIVCWVIMLSGVKW